METWQDPNAAVREGCCRLLDHLADTESMAAEPVGKRAGWFMPGGTGYERTPPPATR